MKTECLDPTGEEIHFRLSDAKAAVEDDLFERCK
jgi:hypothetical protein